MERCSKLLEFGLDQGVITFDDLHIVFYKMGTLSLFLTVANIALIWFASMLMFRMKEVLPIKKKVFWEDLGVARHVYQRRAVLSSQCYESGAERGNEDSASDTEEEQMLS